MRLSVILVLLLIGLAAAGKKKRQKEQGDSCLFLNNKLKMFNKDKMKLPLPCKYNALKSQKCGDFKITLSPFQEFFRKKYVMEGFFLVVKYKNDTDKEWRGRFTNKQSFKFYNDVKHTKFYNPMKTNTIVDLFGNSTRGTEKFGGVKLPCSQVQDKDGTFKISFCHMDPSEGKLRFPGFKFTCLRDIKWQPSDKQMCGDDQKVKGSKIPNRDRPALLYEEVFTNNGIEQTEPLCQKATKIVRRCPDDRRLPTLMNCHTILSDKDTAKCVNQYSCHILDIFNACMEWGCDGFGTTEDQDRDLCTRVGRGLEFCPNVGADRQGNVTLLARQSNCYVPFPRSKLNKKNKHW